MKGKDILQGLEYIGDDLIENAEFGQFPAEEQETRKTRRPIRRPLLVAGGVLRCLRGLCAENGERENWNRHRTA